MAKLKLNSAITEDLKAAASDSFIDNLKMIEVSEIIPNENNFYEMGEIEELAEDIERQGLMSVLVVMENNGKYILISGHRRLAAVKLLIDEGRRKTSTVPCFIKGMKSAEEAELDLIMNNATARKYTNADIMREYEELERIFKAMDAAGTPVQGKIRNHIANILKVSSAQIGKIGYIKNNAIPDVEQAVKSGEMSISTANEVAKLAPEQQKEIIENKPDISHKEVKELQKSSPKPKKTAPPPPDDTDEEISEIAEDTEESGSDMPEAAKDAPPVKSKPCTLSESEAAVLARYITQLLELASESDYDIISGIADRLTTA